MPIEIDTDEAVVYDKMSHFVTHFNEENKRKSAFVEENPDLKTTFLNACIAVYIESEEEIIALHVSPSQANGYDYSLIKPYAHLNNLFMSRGSEISVIVGGHTQNFNEDVFKKVIEEKGWIIKNIIKGNSSPSNLLQAYFNIQDGVMQVVKLTAQIDECETLSFHVGHSPNNDSTVVVSLPSLPSLKR